MQTEIQYRLFLWSDVFQYRVEILQKNKQHLQNKISLRK